MAVYSTDLLEDPWESYQGFDVHEVELATTEGVFVCDNLLIVAAQETRLNVDVIPCDGGVDEFSYRCDVEALNAMENSKLSVQLLPTEDSGDPNTIQEMTLQEEKGVL